MNVPKLRFKEFDGEWGKETLKNLSFKIGDGLHSTPQYELDGEYYFINGNNLIDGKIVFNETTKRVLREEVEKYKISLGKETILLSINGTIGNLAFYNGEKILLGKSAGYIDLNTNKVNKYFLYSTLQTSHIERYFKNELTGTTIKNLSLASINKTIINLPDIKEQNMIGDLFKVLDKKIQLQKQKVDFLQEQKKGFLQKMFPRAGETQPEMRFDGFMGDWKQCKLNNYLQTSKVKNTNEVYTKFDVLSVSGDYGIVNQIEFQGRSFAGVSVAPYGIVEKGDIVYTKSPLKSNPYGIIKVNKGKPGIVSTLYAIYKVRANVDPNFVEYYFADDLRLNKYLKPLVNKGAKNDMKVSDDNALIGDVVFPTDLEEQLRIAEFFKKLEDAINIQQQKLDLLRKQKQGFMQQMFI
ncbi:hypothetical protein BAQ47_00470 [Bacillus tropicus]|uniref:restriction endonuclease subunit S n=1 Tax=Bacillus tropicus TaxID=2026188 RepID=UPI0008FDA5BA|nr:restriction endonuclease subunit S [Bacillus tropicus]OJE40235.1 hypothetical protein BAQ47_00470 [Bacillus tropicus]